HGAHAGGIRADPVALHAVAIGHDGESDRVAGDQVAFSPRAVPADQVDSGIDLDTRLVRPGSTAGDVGADPVPLDLVPGGALADQHPLVQVAGDHVAEGR